MWKRMRLAVPFLVGLVVCSLGVLAPAPEVLAATHIFLEADAITDFYLYPGGETSVTPTGPFPQYFESRHDAGTTSHWYFDYNGKVFDRIVDVAVTVSDRAAGNGGQFVSGANSFPASQLAFREYQFFPMTTPPPNPSGQLIGDYNSLSTYGSFVKVCSRLMIRHQTEPVPMFMRLTLTGDEVPGTYSMEVYIKATPAPVPTPTP